MNEPDEPEKVDRNTKKVDTRSSLVCNQLIRWFFTLHVHEPEISPKELYDRLIGHCSELYFQLERGEDTGKLHFQGCFRLHHKEYFNTVKDIIGDNTVHLEKVKNWRQAVLYCTKEETRTAGPWTHESKWIRTITELRQWQTDLLTELITFPNDRKIVWYTDTIGGAGKTQFAKYLAVHYGALVLNNAKTADIAYATNDPSIVIFNLSRTFENYVNYGAIESLKDGLIFSSKYESKMKLFNSPHVVIFANFDPDLSALSKDRWDIRKCSEPQPLFGRTV